jgi:2-(1,2-epoxy-1,2-dihydrophenyl)acetyl-CoA isomerase
MKVNEKKLETVIITRKDNFAVITMNRPEKLNALSPDLISDIVEATKDVANDEAVRAVIYTGAGQSFSAGGDAEKDINPLREKSPTEFNAYFGHGMEMYTGIMDMEKPAIAAINGYAIGAGMDLALACDIRIAAEDTRLGEFFVRMGLCPESAPYLLPWIVGLGRAKVISLIGDTIDAKEAERIGLVDKVVPPDKLMSAAEELAGKLANGPKAIGLIKKTINESLNMNFKSFLDYLMRVQYQLAHTEDHKEAITAYLEKRKPEFKGK